MEIALEVIQSWAPWWGGKVGGLFYPFLRGIIGKISDKSGAKWESILTKNTSGNQVGGICDIFGGKVGNQITNCDWLPKNIDFHKLDARLHITRHETYQNDFTRRKQ